MDGRLFSVDDKMLCSTHIAKTYGDSLLMACIGEETYSREIEKNEACLWISRAGR